MWRLSLGQQVMVVGLHFTAAALGGPHGGRWSNRGYQEREVTTAALGGPHGGRRLAWAPVPQGHNGRTRRPSRWANYDGQFQKDLVTTAALGGPHGG